METTALSNIGDGRAVRHAWVDNLRVVIITGVIGAHVSLIYALDVGWYYEERTASEAARVILAAIFSPGLVFGMGLLFFIAGLFTPAAYGRKGPRAFVSGRVRRLGIPVVAYVVVINPAMNVLGDRAMGIEESPSEYFRRTYSDDVELGIAWFACALLTFSLGYAVWRRDHVTNRAESVPLQRADLVRATVFIAASSFVVRLAWPFLGTDEMWGLNLWEYPQMVALFVLGVLAEERGWLIGGLPRRIRLTCGIAAAVGAVVTAGLGVAITLTDDPDPFLGGLRIEATLIPIAEAAIAVGMSLWAVDWFRRRWDHPGPLVRAMGRASFTAYLVHAPVTIVASIALRNVAVAGEIKFVTVLLVSFVASFGFGWLATRSHPTVNIL